MPTHPTIVHGDGPDVSARILNILPEVRYRRELSTTRGVRLILGVALPDGPQRAECVEEDAAAVVEFLRHLPGETLAAVARMLQECELADQVEVSE
jgi:hypothetical protein